MYARVVHRNDKCLFLRDCSAQHSETSDSGSNPFTQRDRIEQSTARTVVDHLDGRSIPKDCDHEFWRVNQRSRHFQSLHVPRNPEFLTSSAIKESQHITCEGKVLGIALDLAQVDQEERTLCEPTSAPRIAESVQEGPTFSPRIPELRCSKVRYRRHRDSGRVTHLPDPRPES